MNTMKHSSTEIEALTGVVRQVLKIATALTLIAAAWPGVGVADSHVADVQIGANTEETLTGKLIGYNCAHQGISCAVDRDDPHLSLEQDFVLVEDSGEPYLLNNLDRNTKIQFVLETVMVTGVLNERYKAVTVNEFKVKRGDTYETVWSPELEKEKYLRARRYGRNARAAHRQ